MPVSLDKRKVEQIGYDAEDFQDEAKMKAMMANVMCMTEKDVKRKETQDKHRRHEEQKLSLQNLQNKYAR